MWTASQKRRGWSGRRSGGQWCARRHSSAIFDTACGCPSQCAECSAAVGLVLIVSVAGSTGRLLSVELVTQNCAALIVQFESFVMVVVFTTRDVGAGTTCVKSFTPWHGDCKVFPFAALIFHGAQIVKLVTICCGGRYCDFCGTAAAASANWVSAVAFVKFNLGCYLLYIDGTSPVDHHSIPASGGDCPCASIRNAN